MQRRRFFPLVPVLALAMLAQRAALADDLLDVVPSEALGFLAVNDLAGTDAKIRSTLEAVQVSGYSLLERFRDESGIEGGLDDTRDLAFVAMPPAAGDPEPVVLLLLPVSDFAELLEPFDCDDPSAEIAEVESSKGVALVANLGAYAVAGETRHRQAIRKVLDAKKHAARDLAALRPWIAEQQIAGVATVHGVRYGCKSGRAGLDAARMGMAPSGGDDNPAVAGLQVYDYLFDVAEEDVAAAAVGARVDDDGNVRLTQRICFRAAGGGPGDASSSQRKELLAGIPAGPFVVALGGALDEGLSEAMMDFSVGMMKAAPDLYGLDEEQAEKMRAISRESLAGIRGMSFVLGVGEPGEPVYSNMTFSMRFDDARAYLKTYRRQVEAMNEVVRESDSPVLREMEITEIDVDGTPGLKLVMDLPGLAGLGDGEHVSGLMEGLFGPGKKIRVFMAAADEHTVVAAYSSRRSLRRCLKAVEDPDAALSAEEGVAATAALLPSDAMAVGYWSPEGTIDFVRQAIGLFAPAGGLDVEVPPFPQCPPIGVSGTVSEEEIRTHLVVPSEALAAIGKYVGEIRRMIAERNAL